MWKLGEHARRPRRWYAVYAAGRRRGRSPCKRDAVCRLARQPRHSEQVKTPRDCPDDSWSRQIGPTLGHVGTSN